MSFAHNARGFKTSIALKLTPVQASARHHGTLGRLATVTRSNAVLSTDPEVLNYSDSSNAPTKFYDHGQQKPLVTVLKDNFVTPTLPTTCASLILEGFKGPHESTVGELLQNAGVKVVAKTNMDEFGMGSHSMNSAYGSVRNGIGDTAQSAGGSSGGSAMVVADSIVRVAIGSDTGGSVRLPAAYTGTFGFKPSYGRISRNGLVPYANSLDTVGIISSNVYDLSVVYKILNRPDPADPTCQTPLTRQRIDHALRRRDLKPNTSPDQEHNANIRFIANPGRGLNTRMPGQTARKPPQRGRLRRIGVPDEYNIQEMHPLVRRAWMRTLSLLSSHDHQIIPISLPTTQQALAAYYVLAPAEASSNLAKYDGVRYGTNRQPNLPDNHDGPLYAHHRGQFFGDEVKRRILLGTFSLSAGAMDNYFIQAQKVRRLVQEDFNLAFSLPHPLMDHHDHSSRPTWNPDGVDLIIVPTAPTTPPLLSEVQAQSPLDSYINDVFTVPASLAGLPAISVPVLAHDDLPPLPERSIGMQVIGQYGDDLDVLNFARTEIEAFMVTDGRHGMKTLSRNKL